MNNATVIQFKRLVVKLLISSVAFVAIVYLTMLAFWEKIVQLEIVYAILYFGFIIMFWLGLLSLIALMILFFVRKNMSTKHLK